MNYAEAVEHLFRLGPELAAPGNGGTVRRFDLGDMRTLAAELGDPQKTFPSVLIAGTNGKGSTAATLASILTSAGYRTGLYTSPHLLRANERIQLARPVLPGEYGSANTRHADGALALAPIADADFARLCTQVETAGSALVARGALPMAPSFFERLTALAFLYFAESHAEIVVLEVGLGGRLDATNVVEPVLTVLTDIALDHQEYLGHTISAIAREKCGILRPGVPLVTLSQHPEANQVIGEVAAELGVPGINAADYLPPAQRNAPAAEWPDAAPDPALPLHATHEQGTAHTGSAAPVSLPHSSAPAAVAGLPRNRYSLPLPDGLLQVDSPLAGEHQQRNVALALAAAQTLGQQARFSITREAMAAGVRATRWPGRLEMVSPNMLLDVAHNPAGAWALRAALSSLPSAQPRTLLFSCLRDKNLDEMARILFPLFDSSGGDPERRRDHIVLAPIDSPRATPVTDLLAAAHSLGVPAHAAPHTAGALHQARQMTAPGGLIVVTGSVYLVGEIRQLALEEERAHA